MERKHKFYIMPRQSGKTTKAVELFQQNPDKSLLVAVNGVNAKEIQRNFKLNTSRIISSLSDFKSVRGLLIDHLIMDEYLFFENKKEIFELFKMLLPFLKTITIFSTPDRFYEEDKIYLIKMLRSSTATKSESLTIFTHTFGVGKDEFEKYYYNLLFHPMFEVIRDVSRNYATEDLREIIGDKAVKLEYVNDFII